MAKGKASSNKGKLSSSQISIGNVNNSSSSVQSKTNRGGIASLTAAGKSRNPANRKHFKTPILLKLGERIRKYRLQNTALSQEDFASSINLHRTYLSAVERGEYNLTIITLIQIAKGLDVPVSNLVTGLEKLDNNKDEN